jgi:hypothetical protein
VVKRGVALILGGVLWWVLLPRAAYSHNPTTTTVLFNREITTLLQRKCSQCHADGKLAMPLGTYAQTRPWAEAIKEEALARRMPPWPAERGYGTFSNDIGLTPREFEFLISWIDGGVPEGTDAPAPVVDHSAHWTLGMPDVVLSPSAATTIDAHRPAASTRMVIETGLTHDAWVRALDFKPDSRVARAASLSIAGTTQYLGSWTPWQSSTELPADAAFKLPSHARIAVDVLYSGASDPVADKPQLALYLASSGPGSTIESTTLHAAPDPHVAGRFVAEFKAADARALVSIRPDLGAARSLEIRAVHPDGSCDVLLWIKDARHAWPTPYVFKKPVMLAPGSVLQAIAYAESPPASSITIELNHYAQK